MFDLKLGNGVSTNENDEEFLSFLFRVFARVGRLPGQIGSCYGVFTVEQWKNWALVYSVVALKCFLSSNQSRGLLLSYILLGYYAVQSLTTADTHGILHSSRQSKVGFITATIQQ